MAIERENVQTLMEWTAQGGTVRSSNTSVDALVDQLAALVFQGDTNWPGNTDQLDNYLDLLRGQFASDGAHEAQFVEMTRAGADPNMFVDWLQPVVAEWEGRRAQESADPASDGASAVTQNPNFDGTPGTRFYRYDDASQEYQYSDAADGGDWAAYEKRRYTDPAKDENYGLHYRYDNKDGVYEWHDEAGGTWQNQAWADQHVADRQGPATQGSPTPAPAAHAAADPKQEWDDDWRMFYRVDNGVYQFADAVTPGDKHSGCGDTWMTREEALARSGHGRPKGGDHATAVDNLHHHMLAAVGSALQERPHLQEVLTDEDLKRVMADVVRELTHAGS